MEYRHLFSDFQRAGFDLIKNTIVKVDRTFDSPTVITGVIVTIKKDQNQDIAIFSNIATIDSGIRIRARLFFFGHILQVNDEVEIFWLGGRDNVWHISKQAHVHVKELNGMSAISNAIIAKNVNNIIAQPGRDNKPILVIVGGDVRGHLVPYFGWKPELLAKRLKGEAQNNLIPTKTRKRLLSFADLTIYAIDNGVKPYEKSLLEFGNKLVAELRKMATNEKIRDILVIVESIIAALPHE